MITLLLGAGFSKWAFNLPLVDHIFDFDISTTNEQESRKLELLESDWSKWRSKNLEGTPEKFIYWSIYKSSHRRSRIIWYVNRRLTEPFMTRISGSYTAAMFDERVVRENEQIIKIKKFLLSIVHFKLNGIITCNYDTIIECALGTSGFNYGIPSEQLYGRGLNPQFPWQNAHVRVSGEIPLLKLHGSLSWDSAVKYTSGKPGRAGNALIVPPAPEKEPPAELADIWSYAAKVLGRSECLIVFGFGFNPYDVALLEFLRINGAKLNKVLLIDPYPNIDAAKALWSTSEIDIINPRLGFKLSDHAWFAKEKLSVG